MKKEARTSPRAYLIALGALLLTACGFGKVELKWAEQVQLADRQVIVIQRTAKGDVQGEGFTLTGWAPTEMTLAFQGISDRFKTPPDWRTKYTPILLDYEASTRTWSVVATFNYCEEWRDLGKPALPYIEYQSRDGAPWGVIPLEQRLIGWERNLLTGPSSKGEPPLVTLQSKTVRGGNSASKYRKIVSEWKDNFC